MIKSCLCRNNFLPAQILFVLLCCSIAFLLIGYPLIMTDSLYWDYPDFYSFFRNSFLSVLLFGEIRWWDPTIQYGFPSYHFSFLGLYGCTPLFWTIEGLLFVLRGLGVQQINVHYLVVIYSAFLIPLLFNLSLLTLARQIFKTNSTILLVIIMAAFSPGVIFGISIIAFEMTAYGLFTAAALLAFLRNTNAKTYLVLNLAACVLLLTFNHPSLFWNPLFLTVFLSTLLMFPEKKWSESVADLAEIPKWQHLLFLTTLLACTLPTILCYLDGAEILRSSIGRRQYTPLEIRRGSPLEFLLAGIPGIVMVRNDLTVGMPTLMPTKEWAGYMYLGALTLPLAFLGITFGQKPWRFRLLLLMAFFSIAVMLGGYSAILSILYLPDSPLRAVNHFGDMTFINGLFALIILAAGLGYEALIISRLKRIRPVFFAAGGVWLLAISGAVVAALYITFAVRVPAEASIIGFMASLCFFYLPFLFWVWLKPGFGKPLQILFVCILFLDLTCSMYLYVRFQILPQSVKVADDYQPFAALDKRLNLQENIILVLKDITTLKEKTGSIPDIPELGILGNGGITPINNNPSQLRKSYNHLTVTVTTEEEAKLVWRDSWFKWWRATVNGKPVPIEKYLGAFKAVAVPRGESTVTFTFRPQSLFYSLIAGWSCVLMLTLCIVTSSLRRK